MLTVPTKQVVLVLQLLYEAHDMFKNKLYQKEDC